MGLLLGAGAAAGLGLGLLVSAFRHGRAWNAQSATPHARAFDPQCSDSPRRQWPARSAVRNAEAIGAAESAGLGPSEGRRTAVRPEALLGADEMSGLRTQVDSLCKTLSQSEANALLLAELMDSGVTLNAYRAAGLARIASQVLASPGVVEELATAGPAVSSGLVTQLQDDLRSIANSLDWLANAWMQGSVDADGLRAELQLQVRMTAQLSPVERLLFLSTLLLASVSDLSSALADRCNRLRNTVRDQAASLGIDRYDALNDEIRAARPWPRQNRGGPRAGMEWGDDLFPGPHGKLN
jgi:hypothetical protein